jgi:hypothetical protein
MGNMKAEVKPEEYWVGSIAAAMQSAGIEWMPGCEGGKLTLRQVVSCDQVDVTGLYSSGRWQLRFSTPPPIF